MRVDSFLRTFLEFCKFCIFLELSEIKTHLYKILRLYTSILNFFVLGLLVVSLFSSFILLLKFQFVVLSFSVFELLTTTFSFINFIYFLRILFLVYQFLFSRFFAE